MAITNTDLKKKVYEILKNNWDNANTSISTDPRFSTGWFDKGKDFPQVTVTNKNEVSGQEYDFIKADGSGPGKDVKESVQVNTWVHKGAVDVDPKTLSEEMKNEVKRLIHNRFESLSDYHLLGHGTPREIPQAGDVRPHVFRFNIPVFAKWFQTP